MAKAIKNTKTCAPPNARTESKTGSSDGENNNMAFDGSYSIPYAGPVNQHPAPARKELRMRFEIGDPVKRGRRPAEIPASVEGAVAILVTDGATIPLAWKRGRARRTYALRNGQRVTIWLRKEARGYKPGSEWSPVTEGVYVPTGSGK